MNPIRVVIDSKTQFNNFIEVMATCNDADYDMNEYGSSIIDALSDLIGTPAIDDADTLIESFSEHYGNYRSIEDQPRFKQAYIELFSEIKNQLFGIEEIETCLVHYVGWLDGNVMVVLQQ